MPRNNASRQAPMAVPHGPFREFTPEEVARAFERKMLAEERLAEVLGVDPVFVRLAKEIGFTKDEQEVTTIIRIAKGELAPEDVSERDYVRDRYERFANIILEFDRLSQQTEQADERADNLQQTT